MRVLLISHSAALYGAQRSLLDLAIGLRKAKIEVVATVPEKGPLMDLLQRAQIEVRMLPCRNWVNSRGTYHWARKYVIAKRQANKAAVWISQDRFDIIHTNSLVTPVGAMAAKKVKLPHIWHVREGMPPAPDFFFLSFDKVREFINETTTAMIGISQHSCEGMREFCPEEKIRLIYNGPLDSSLINRPLPPKQTVGSPIRVLCVGRSGEAKGHDVAAKAVAKLRAMGIPVTLTIAGEIPETFEKKLKLILPEGLELPGFVAEPTELYQTHDILAMASKQEAFGRVTVEAMASGCVVVGSASGATPELIGHNVTGVLVQPEIDEALAEGILGLRNDQDLYESLRSAAHKDAYSRFTRERYADEVADLYRKTLRA